MFALTQYDGHMFDLYTVHVYPEFYSFLSKYRDLIIKKSFVLYNINHSDTKKVYIFIRSHQIRDDYFIFGFNIYDKDGFVIYDNVKIIANDFLATQIEIIYYDGEEGTIRVFF